MEIQIPCEKKLELLDIPTLVYRIDVQARLLILRKKFPSKRCFSWNKKEIPPCTFINFNMYINVQGNSTLWAIL